METSHKRILRALSLALRHELEGWRDETGTWRPGDLERRLAELGIHRERSKPLDEMTHLASEDRRARLVVDGYLELRADAGVERDAAVAEFVRESAYTWANRLLALRCMEARSIIEEVVLQKAPYADRSLVHHRFLRKNPHAAEGADDGLFAVLFEEFSARAAELPALFDPQAAAVALRPSVAALKRCVALLSGTEAVRGQEPASDEVFSAPDAFGWAYQYWNTEEKDRVFEAVRTKKGTKIEGADIIPATQLYTEPYMVKFLVQNSLGALWMSLHPESRLCDGWEYYVRDADRAPFETPAGGRSVRDFTFLDPALGSGHFHLEAFDLFFAMYREESPALTAREIAASILNRNLFGIDLDDRAVQIAEAALWMKAKDGASELEAADLDSFHDHLLATNIHLPHGRDHLEVFLRQHPEDAPLRPALALVFRGLEHADELGSLLQIEEPVDRELRRLKAEADAANTTPPVQPDMFRATAVQSALPMGVESYEGWKAGALDRLKAHFEQEAEAADSVRAFFGASARKGLALFALLARRYEVVAANPPYMGSKNMGAVLKSLVERGYPAGKRDLYAAFILRCRELAAHGGRLAMATQQSWMFLRSFVKLRAPNEDDIEPGDFRGLLRETSIEVIAHLGPGGFSEVSGEVVKTVLLVTGAREPNTDHRVLIIAPDEKADPATKAAELRSRRRVWSYVQIEFIRDATGSMINYWMPPDFWRALESRSPLSTAARARKGITTMDNQRFVRWRWEIVRSERWVRLAKSISLARWITPETHCVEWEGNGTRTKMFVREGYGGGHWSRAIANADLYFHHGCWCSIVCGGNPSFRRLSDAIFETKVIAVVPHQSTISDDLLAYLNTSFVTYLLRSYSPGLETLPGAVERLPLPNSFPDYSIPSKTNAERISGFSTGTVPFGFHFNPTFSLRGMHRDCVIADAFAALEMLCHQARNSSLTFAAFEISNSLQQTITAATGGCISHLPSVAGYSEVPTILDDSRVAEFVARRMGEVEAVQPTAELRQQLSECYQRFSSDANDVEEPDSADGTEPVDFGDSEDIEIRNLPETFLEALSLNLQIHPVSVFWLLKEGIEQKEWRCFPEEKRLTEDRFTVLVLRILGHRWPNQIEASEPLPEWTDRDGVIPISPGSTEPSLAARVLERLDPEFPGGAPAVICAEFEEIVGAPLEAWLVSGFFARHITQFKKRPIAWQLQSQPAAQPGRRRSTPVRGPAFACLVYCHRLDADLLPKLRSHYLAVLRTAHETELRTLEALAQPTPDQGARKAELEVLVDELNRFDAQLQALVESGFCPAPLQPRLRQLAFDDAMLAMKARWLARLRETLQAAPLADWQTAATALGHHAEFPRWIATAISCLPHHCAQAGAQSPDAARLPEDPTPTTLAAVICAETDAMTATALDLACAEWMHEWDTNVIQLVRARITTANTALETLSTELEMLDRSNATRLAAIALEQKRLRAEVKTLKAEIKTKTEKAGQLVASIRKWTSPELPTWESWLASGPLFDEVSTLDGYRAAPVTIRDFIQQESYYAPDLNDGVRVNIAPLQRAGILAGDVLATKDVEKAIADRADWRADERRWVREGKLRQPGWWPSVDGEAQP